MIIKQLRPHIFKINTQSYSSLSASNPGNITIRKIGPITCFGLNRPAKKNCLNLEVVKDLKEAIEHFEAEPSSLIGVLFGERGTFCYGYDAEEFSENPRLLESIEEIGLFKKFSSKPLVAAVSGHALGPGFDLALWCDFRIVEDTALLGGYARKFGTPTEEVILSRLHSAVGLNKALDLVLTGRLMTAKESLECGVATRIVACGSGLGQGVSFAQSLANFPQACLKADRATLISLSGKYDPESTKKIYEEAVRYRKKAYQEAIDGIHLTETGDVRHKAD